MKGIYSLLFFSILFSFCKTEKPKKESTPTLSKTEEIAEPIIAPTDAFIKKYKGEIGNELAIELVLINWANGTLGGYYTYKKGSQIPKKIELSGELNLNETFVLNEFVEDDFTGKLTGSLSELNSISGMWSNADSSESKTYSLKEVSQIDKKGWTGAWYRNETHSPGTLILGNVTDKTVDFGLEIFNGGHSGVLEGTATLNGGVATFNSTVFGAEEKCHLVFQIQNKKIIISQKSSSGACGFGMRAIADGIYDSQLVFEKLVLPFEGDNKVFTNKEQHDAFAILVGEDYQSYAFNMQNIGEVSPNSSDDFSTHVYVGSVAGLGTMNEAIIMRSDRNDFWAATIIYKETEDDFYVKYHTNDESRKNTLPVTIEEWRSRFDDFKVVQ